MLRLKVRVECLSLLQNFIDVDLLEWRKVLAYKVDQAYRLLELFEPLIDFREVDLEVDDVSHHSLLAKKDHICQVTIEMLPNFSVSKVQVP